MKFAVRYYTSTGNTKKLADKIAETIGVDAFDTTIPVSDDVDVLFLGSSVYAAGVAKEIAEYIDNLNTNIIVVNFSTAAIIKSTYKQVSKLLEKKGIKLYEKEFACKGQFKAFLKGKPDENDLKNAADFAAQIVAELNN